MMRKIFVIVLVSMCCISCDSINEKKIIGKWENKDSDRLADVACQLLTNLDFRKDHTYQFVCKYTPLYNGEYIQLGCLNSYFNNSITVELVGTWRIRNGNVIVEIQRNNVGLNLDELGVKRIQSVPLSQLTDSIMILDDTKYKRIQ